MINNLFSYFFKGEVYDFRQKEHAIIDEFSQKAQWSKINQAIQKILYRQMALVSHPETPEVGGQGGHLLPQVLGYQLTLFGPMGAEYARHITTCPPIFSDDAASLSSIWTCRISNSCCFLQASTVEKIKKMFKIQHFQINNLPRT